MTFLTQSDLLTPTQRVQRAHIQLMSNEHTQAYAGVLMVGKYEVRSDVPTARTNGLDCVYGIEFVTKQDDAALRGLVMHENLHKCFQHLFLWKHLYEQNAKLANMACDHVINLIIHDLEQETSGFVRLPDGGLLDERFRGMSSQEVFDILLQEQEDEGGDGGEDSDEGGDSEGNGDSGGPSKQGKEDDTCLLDDHDWESASDMSDEEVEEAKKEIDQAIRQGQFAAGKLGGKQSRVLSDLLEPKVDWREQLREFISSTTSGKDISTWQRPNRRWLQHDIYMPSTLSETVGRIVIAPDMSGSTASVLNEFLAEVRGATQAVQPEKVDLIYWDTDVTRHEVYVQEELDKLMDSTKPVGGGGTDVRCVPSYMKRNQLRPECVIVITDGYLAGGWGTWDVPVLWCIHGNKTARPSTGVTIHID